ncbi:MAG: putative HTH-type transcriptional regulator YdcR [Synergistetes bacterium ADurb.Bin155]|nr:PLP-dependent aminotransferase family protein [Synergistales bacterium]MBP8996330.1 PLP-dependent aminotransferase family protein [Synergistales bacterium]NMD17269.1 PLP-dependent aminotransferase family protein [Synergistaceae bacterium]OQB45064.1 MAG: putative HTH-type transcriptional regulator YdcR [Synergistetes bacterium ADurb.Bin155]HQL02632.1 PLP-dependent aminotransferase family protein [Synergistales bacterium]
MIEIPLDPAGRAPLYRQIATHLMKMVQNGTLAPGDRLPGSRDLSSSLGLSRNTVVLAYDLLEDEGFIEQRGRRGAFISWKGLHDSGDIEEDGPRWDMASGLPSFDLVPSGRLAALARDALLSSGPGALYDTPPEGLMTLRNTLVKHAATRGIPAKRDEAVVTSGARHALSVYIHAMALKGVRRLWIEELTYPEVRLMAQGAGLEIATVPVEPEAFQASLAKIGPGELLYLIPSFHNPTGRTLSHEQRKNVLEAASRIGFWVIEDDAYGELRFGESSVPALKSIDQESRVLYLGSFSQLLFPGMRIGYVLMPEETRKEFLSVLERTSGSTSSLVQHLVNAFIEDRSLEVSLDLARNSMASRMRTLCNCLGASLPGLPFETPQGGIYLWLRTPGRSGTLAAGTAKKVGVGVVPGRLFSYAGEDIEAVRLSVSRLSTVMIQEAVDRFVSAWEKQS